VNYSVPLGALGIVVTASRSSAQSAASILKKVVTLVAQLLFSLFR
jgi:hypothetical protein